MRIPYRWRRHVYKIRRKWRKYRRLISFYIFDFDSRVYEINKRLDPYFRAFSVFLALMAIVSVLLPLGLPLEGRLKYVNEMLEVFLLGAFILQFAIRLILTSQRMVFIKHRWLESIATLIAVFFMSQLLADQVINVGRTLDILGQTFSRNTAQSVVKGYLIFFIVVKFLQSLPRFIAKQQNTGQFLVYSFLSIIAFGTLLLMLPKATQDGGGLAFINALFTSTSAICVTGLIVVDTATRFTLFGELIILFLIQIGGLGIITFATFLALFVSEGFSVGQKNVLRDVVQQPDVSLITTTLKRIVGLTLLLEAVGAVTYYFSWSPELFQSSGQRILFSVFHAVSAFCNAGFSLFSNSLADPANATNIPVNITTMLLIVLGGLGFPTIWELYHRARKKKNHTSIQTRIILMMTVVLIVGGALAIYFLEQNQAIQGRSFTNSIMYSVFQSITTRTAGFNTMDIGSLSVSTTLVLMLLMIIGASPASTAGGIKTTTAYMLFSTVVNTVRGRSRMEVGNRTIPESVLRRALTSLTLAFICLSVSTILLAAVEDAPLIDLLFEEISAFATVGLSRGITFDLSVWGKVIIIMSMFIGRVGSLTLAASFVTKRDNRNYRYPEESIMVS